MRKKLRPFFFGTAFAAMIGAGCMMPEGKEEPQWLFKAPVVRSSKTESGPVEPNIVRVNKFFSQTPWLSYANDGSRSVDGVTFSIYLEGPVSPKGVFGTGVITVTMYRLEGDDTGREVVTKLYEWEYDAQAAYPFQANKQTALGWGYGMRLRWGSELDVEGDQVAFVIKYTREDGRVVSSSRQVLKVPGEDGSSHIAQRTGGVVETPKPRPRPRISTRLPHAISPVAGQPGQVAAEPAVSEAVQEPAVPTARPKPRVTISVKPAPERPKLKYTGPSSGGK